MARVVPLGRRNLLADGRRLAAGVAGVGLSVMLVLLLGGLWTGIVTQASAYGDRVGADLFVAQPGTRNLVGDVSVIPAATVDAVRADPGVAWAAPVRGLYSIVDLHGRKVPSYLVGSVPGQPGGPWAMAAGRPARTDTEIVVDRVLARRHGLALGDELAVMGRQFRIVGLSRETTSFSGSYLFVTHDATDALLQAPGTTSYILAGTSQPAAVRERLAAQGLNVLTRSEVVANDRQVLTGILGKVLRLMVGVAFAAGTLMIALTAYTAVAERRREYGIVKAMGATGWRLLRLAIGQTLVLAGLGLAAGGGLFVAGRALIIRARPQFSVVLTAGGVGRAVAATLLMALVAAVVPARRLAALDPATAYRGG